MTETATATNPTEASASTEASATLLASEPVTTGSDADKSQQTQTTDTQAAKPTETQAEGTEKTGTDTTTQSAPEKYTFTAPEGSDFDPDVLESFSGAAKEAGITQDAAQKLIEKMAPALVARQVDQVQAIQKEWRDASSSDKEFGGEKLAENLGVARKALDMLDPLPNGAGANGVPKSTPLRVMLEETGLGNHPEVIRILFRAGKAISEDRFVGGHAAGTGTASPTSVLYDKTSK